MSAVEERFGPTGDDPITGSNSQLVTRHFGIAAVTSGFVATDDAGQGTMREVNLLFLTLAAPGLRSLSLVAWPASSCLRACFGSSRQLCRSSPRLARASLSMFLR